MYKLLNELNIVKYPLPSKEILITSLQLSFVLGQTQYFCCRLLFSIHKTIFWLPTLQSGGLVIMWLYLFNDNHWD